MKKGLTIFTTLFLVFLSSTPTIASNQSNCENALISLMWEDIHKAVNEYYYDIEGVQFTDEKILNIKMKNALDFEITIKIDTFIGAHNTIGTDTLKFVQEELKLNLVSYKHNPSKDKKEILEWFNKNRP